MKGKKLVVRKASFPKSLYSLKKKPLKKQLKKQRKPVVYRTTKPVVAYRVDHLVQAAVAEGKQLKEDIKRHIQELESLRQEEQASVGKAAALEQEMSAMDGKIQSVRKAVDDTQTTINGLLAELKKRRKTVEKYYNVTGSAGSYLF